jgi:membrane-bound serine protease (ClpP class)
MKGLRVLALGLLASGVALVGSTARADSAAQEPASLPLVLTAEVDGIIHPVSAEFMMQTIDRADAANARLVVFTLRTPGGLVDSTRSIVSKMIAAKTPVAVFVAPSGARAASAGFLITIAADIAAMAPGTHIGAAHPVSGSGEKMDDTTAKKAAADVAAYARSIAARRNRNVSLVEQAVIDSRAFTEDEALKASPPLIDIIAPDLTALLRQIDGRSISRFDGRAEVVRTAQIRIEKVEMSFRQRLLSAIAHPQVAYLLFSLGTLGLTIELWSPGAILPGVAGGLCLLLAFFAFQILPVNYAGLLLILFGLILLVLEIKVASFGLLGLGGIAGLLLGAMILIDSPLPELQIGLQWIVPITLALAGIVLFLARLALDAQRRKSVTGDSGMIGETGRTLTPVAPDRPGQVATHGEIWSAVSDEPLAQGEQVRVVELNGLILVVRRDPVVRP